MRYPPKCGTLRTGWTCGWRSVARENLPHRKRSQPERPPAGSQRSRNVRRERRGSLRAKNFLGAEGCRGPKRNERIVNRANTLAVASLLSLRNSSPVRERRAGSYVRSRHQQGQNSSMFGSLAPICGLRRLRRRWAARFEADASNRLTVPAASVRRNSLSSDLRELRQLAGLVPEFQMLADRRMKEINAAYEILKQTA